MSRNQDEQKQTKQEQEAAENEKMQEYGQMTLENNGGKKKIHLLSIIGEVEGHENLSGNAKATKYDHVLPQLAALEDDDQVEVMLVLLNTSGGDVDAGLAIAELISGMKTPTVSLVLGGGHSIGVPLACSARHSFISPSATMTVHPVRMNGLVLGVPQTLSYFDKMQQRITRFVCDNSSISPQRFRRLMMKNGELVMDVGSVLDGEAAVKEGLIDDMGGLAEAIECLYQMIEEQDAEKENGQKEDEK